MAALCYFIRTRNLFGLQVALNDGENPNIQDERGNTFLHLVAFTVPEDPENDKYNLEVAQILIQFGADVDRQNDLEMTPLHIAVAYRNYEMIRILLEAGAEVDLKDCSGNAALHYSINNHILLKIVDPEYNIPKDSCADWRIVKQLLKFHPDVNIANTFKETPLMWAVIAGDHRIVRELLRNKALQNMRNDEDNTALHVAVSQPEINLSIVTELLRYGSCPDIRNKQFQSPLDLYLFKVQDDPSAEDEKAPHIFKLFLLKRNNLHDYQLALMRKEDAYYIFCCRFEILMMKRDKVKTCCSVYDIVSLVWGKNRRLSSGCCDKLLAKLLSGKYTIYLDVIASCFPPVYLSRKFAEMCCWRGRNDEWKAFLNFKVRFILSRYYLSPVDVCNMILAGTEKSF